MSARFELSSEELYRRTDPVNLGFETTADLEPLAGALGQREGIAALEFGVSMQAAGYNLFVLGESGSGRRTFVLEALHERARREPAPPDWCYVQNFLDARQPRAVAVSAGRGAELRDDVAFMVEELRRSVAQALEGDIAAGRRAAVLEAAEREAHSLSEQFRADIRKDGWLVLRESEQDYQLLPARGGEPLDHNAYTQLSDTLRDTVDAHMRDARARLLSIHRRVAELQREARDAVIAINQETTRAAVQHHVDVLATRWREEPAALAHLHAVADDIVRNQDAFVAADREKPQALVPQEDFFKRYAVNVVVRHDPAAGAPVVEERHPTYSALVGHVARQLQFGVMTTDFTGITAGALHRANGGYLVLDAEELLARPLAWSALKRVLRTRELKPVDSSGEVGLVVADTLDPAPIPAALKVILVGEPGTFYSLRAMDDEFRELFKVKVDFRPDMERTAETERAYAAFVAGAGPREAAPPFSAAAVARIAEEGSRIAADQNKLTTRFGLVADLVRESAHWARYARHDVVQRDDVMRALRERDTRERRPHRAFLEMIERGILAFEPMGESVGQLYGLAVITVGDEAFGRPMRIMSTAFVGSGGLSNLEREVAMTGPIHNKAFLLLSGYVARRFGRNRPLMLSATISFDQVYEEVEGDSASAAELFALLSAISGVPIRQGVACTGSVNQTGAILPVGGVTEKIEGFFAACQKVGLTRHQGVIVPRRNAENLVLREEVRDAVDAGLFHVWAIDRFEDGWPILTGMVAGEPDDDLEYEEGTLYRAVTDRLDQWACQVQAFQSGLVLAEEAIEVPEEEVAAGG